MVGGFRINTQTNSSWMINHTIFETNRDLTIRDEDGVLDQIVSLSGRDGTYFGLSEFIHFEFASADAIRNFFDSSLDFVSDINAGIWRSIGKRLILPVSSTNESRLDFPFDSESPTKGIIAHLTDQCGGNVHLKGVVQISASSTHGINRADHLADLEFESVFASEDRPNQWFCYDFNSRPITPSYYAVRTYMYKRYNPRSWVIESSVDGSSWTEIDRHENSRELRAVTTIRTFRLGDTSTCRMIRFRQTSPNHEDNHYLCLTSFEVFGRMEEPTEE
jgi:hypothetical protein